MKYKLAKAFLYAFSLLPFWALYAFSSFVAMLIYHVVRYRRKVVRDNLVTAFPEKSLGEIKRIERGFYQWFCDYFVETVKMFSLTPKKISSHIEFRGLELVEQCFDEGQSVAGVLGHYCNWEYLSTTAVGLQRWGLADNRAQRKPEKHSSRAVIGLIYHPLYSQVANNIFLDMREALGGTCIPKQDILRHLLSLKREGRMSIFGYIADQSPKWENIHLWLPFLHHETPVFTGAERIIRKMQNAVFYVDAERPKRGCYVFTFRLITRHPEQLPEFELTRRFFQMLEESICRDPRFYLWSHNRWKRTREEFDRRFQVVGGKVVRK